MKVVVDTNILFSFFWKNSLTKRLLESGKLNLISPNKSLEELKKYSTEISTKTGITQNDFNNLLTKLKTKVKFIPKTQFENFLNPAKKISPDTGDTDFLAPCLKENTFLWSNDKLLKTQDKLTVLTTEELIDLIF